MNQYSPSLPIELIQLILSFLPKSYLIHLLINPPNQDWLYATASVIYHRLVFTKYNQLAACHNLFEQTRQRRQRQRFGSKANDQHGFYSTINYATFVRQIDLSLVREKERLGDSLLLGLTLDCRNLCKLNLYNCYTLTTDFMVNLLFHCPQLENLSLVGATGLDVSCFLHSRVLSSSCQQLRVLNLNLIPFFFNPPAATFAKYKRHFRNKDDKQLPRFPKLQELKLGAVYQQKHHLHDDNDTFLYTLMILRCENIDTLSMDSMWPPHIKICLHSCRHLRAITLRRCYFYKGMFDSLLSQYQPQQQHHQMERLEIDHCFATTTDGNNKATMNSIWNELMAADYHRLEWLGCNKMTLPPDLLGRMVTHVSGCYLTRFDCPDSMTDDTLRVLMTRCPSLTHLSICMFWAHYDRQQQKRSHLTLEVLTQALSTWQRTLEWLEITEGRDGPDVYQQYDYGQGTDDADNDLHRHSPMTLKTRKEQQAFVDFLCDWRTGNNIQVLLLGGMALRLSMTVLERLAYNFPNTRYLAFAAEETMHTSADLEHTMSTWKLLDGFLCTNQSTLMARHNGPWLEWKWMEAKKEQFRRWKSHDFVY